MNRKIFYSISIIILGIAGYTTAWAQGEFVVESSDIDDAEVLIEKQTVLTLPMASRIYEQMQKVKEGKANTAQTYNLDLLPYSLADLDPTIPPASARRIFGDLPSRYYVAAGIGNYISPFLDAYASLGESETFRAGVGLYHFSSLLGPVDGRNSGSGITQADAFGEYFTNVGNFGVKLGYENRSAHFYGYEDTVTIATDFEPERDSIRQSFNTLIAGISHEFAGESAFHIKNEIDFYTFSDRFEARETNLRIFTKPGFQLNEEMNVGLGIELIANQRTDAAEQNRNLLKARPVFQLNKEKLQLEIGAGVAYNGDTTFTDKEIYIYPHLKAAYQVIENRFAVELSVLGDLHQQTLRGFTEQNAFVQANLPLAHTDEALNAELALQISPVNNVGFKLGGGYALQKNLFFFVNDALDPTRFTLLYEPDNVGTMRVFGEFHADWKSFRAILRESYFQYNLNDNVAEAWHRPELYGELLLQYHYQEKVKVTLDLYHMHGLQAFNPVTQSAESLDDIIDLNLNGEYAINENIAVFLQMRNLLAQKYQRYYHYPVRGLTVLVGGSFSF